MGHQLIEPYELRFLYIRRKYFNIAVAVFHWLIQELYVELKDHLDGIEIKVIDGTHHHPDNSYPVLGVFYENLEMPDKGPLIEATIERLLKKRSVIELVNFISENDIDEPLAPS